ncbi:MAG: HIT domain-containing protein [Lentisphaerota bacterium]
MKRLWAPWRMSYIAGIKSKGCFLCDMFNSRADRSHLIIHRGATCVLVMNRYPYNGGHLMVAPVRHLDSFDAMTDAEMLEMMKMTRLAMQALRKVCHPHGFNVGINLGEAAGAGLKDHIHTHVVPRWNGDTNFMPVFADIKVMPQTLEEMRDQLVAAMKQTPTRGKRKLRKKP